MELRRIREFFQAAFGRFTTYPYRLVLRSKTRITAPLPEKASWGRPDYSFWRKAYRCQVQGLEVSGLLIKPLVSKIAAWTLGRPPEWLCSDQHTQNVLAKWWEQHHSDILRAWTDAVKVGDAFIVINPDLSVVILPPEACEPIVDSADPSVVIGWRVTQEASDPADASRKLKIVDEYTLDARTRTVVGIGMEVDAGRNSTLREGGRKATRQENTFRFKNLLRDRLPIVHIANSPDEGEVFGHPEAEGLLAALHRYGILLDAAIDGNVLQGRPTPVITFQNKSDMDRFWELYGTRETQKLPDGTTETVYTLSVDLAQLFTLTAATFEYKSPGSSSQDTQALLQLLFYLILEHTELPEFVFGNAIQSSRASAETQMPVFVRFIEARQREMETWLKEIAMVVLRYLSLSDPLVDSETVPQIQWEQLIKPDGKLTLATVSWAFKAGLLDERTALLLSPIDVKNIDQVLEIARKERDERRRDANGEERRKDDDIPEPVHPGFDSPNDSMRITSPG